MNQTQKTLFSGALRKHSDSEHNTHIQTQTHHGKRTVHRGCHTDDSVRSESSSTSDSTGHDNGKWLGPPLPVFPICLSTCSALFQFFTPVYSHLSHSTFRSDYPETHQIHRPLPPPPSHPPPRSQDSSSSGPSEPGAAGEGLVRVNTARRSNGSDGFPDRITPPEEGGLQQGGMWVNGVPGSRGTNATGVFRSSNALLDGRTRINNGPTEVGMREGGAGRGRGRGGRGGGYSEVLLDYVWGKQQQLQRQQSQPNSRQPITSQHQPLYNGHSSQQLPGALPTYHGPHGDQQRVKVTRTKSCGPFLPMQQSQSNTHNPPASTIQPDPHPHLLPPRPPQLPPNQDSQLEEATRSLHKALALEGLRDWYLRNTVGLAGGGGALQRRRTTHGIIHQSTYQAETSHRHATSRHKQTLPHSATFHGHPLHGRSVDSSLYHDSFPPQKQEVPLRDSTVDQPSPGTLV
uniref:Uncharacterized protein n=1 Tax=Anabas testudineus TaxID=64144 RepID=A0A3Q1JA54_ANATE